jgi:hypothetical protein
MFSSSNAGANGDTANFTDAHARTSLVDHEADPATVHTTGEPRGTSLASSGPSASLPVGDAPEAGLSGAHWRAPQNRGAAGDFDDWNPRGEMGSGAPNTPGGSLTEKVKGKHNVISSVLDPYRP